MTAGSAASDIKPPVSTEVKPLKAQANTARLQKIMSATGDRVGESTRYFSSDTSSRALQYGHLGTHINNLYDQKASIIGYEGLRRHGFP